CALVRDALRCILTKSRFRPVRILPTLDGGAENHLGSAGICIWLLGVRECASITNDLVRRVVAANPSVRPVILAEFHTANDIIPALASGACGFLCQNIPGKQLIKSLELVLLGPTVMFPQFRLAAVAQKAVQSHPTREFEATRASSGNGGYNVNAEFPPHSEVQPPTVLLASPAAETLGTSNGGPAGEVVRDLS